jgi:L-ascorbate metabolism protein UlaG (beta-lactamase superfamily)
LFASRQIIAQERDHRPSFFKIIFRNQQTAPSPYRPEPHAWDSSTVTAAWLGHATVLINFFGTTIITDPVFSEKIGINLLGMTTLGPKRLVAPALRLEELPPIDLILLSHAHMDHLDFPTLRRMDKNIPVIMAKNTSELITGRGWKNVREIDWGESTTYNGIMIEALQVKHFGWRFPWEPDRSKGIWNGRSYNAYLLSKNGNHILFCGDTAYQEFFKTLAEKNITVDLAMMPIGAYDPWIRVHANPEQAVQMAKHMNAKSILPIHWNTFTLSSEPQSEPIERLKKALAEHLPTLALDDIGKTWKLG